MKSLITISTLLMLTYVMTGCQKHDGPQNEVNPDTTSISNILPGYNAALIKHKGYSEIIIGVPDTGKFYNPNYDIIRADDLNNNGKIDALSYYSGWENKGGLQQLLKGFQEIYDSLKSSEKYLTKKEMLNCKN